MSNQEIIQDIYNEIKKRAEYYCSICKNEEELKQVKSIFIGKNGILNLVLLQILALEREHDKLC